MRDFDWWANKGYLKNVLGIRSILRDGLRDWIYDNFLVTDQKDRERVNALVNYIVDTYLDKGARVMVKAKDKLTSKKTAENATEFYMDDYSDADIETGNIIGFTNRCVSKGYILLRREKTIDEFGDDYYVYKTYDEYDGLKRKAKRS